MSVNSLSVSFDMGLSGFEISRSIKLPSVRYLSLSLSTTPPPISNALSPSAGSSQSAARADHTHGVALPTLRDVSSDTVLDLSYYNVLVDATLGDITITLPLASTCPNKIYTIKKTDGTVYNVTISGDDIDDGDEYKLYVRNQVVTMQSNSSQWWVLNN